nr:tRNA pseudouridine(38-40) synthase TruA [Candidatus Bathyarchaeota archaeon]
MFMFLVILLRYAVKLAYLGTNYFGFQRQPSKVTVESVLLEGLRRAGMIGSVREAKYASAGRTDRGVHAVSQVIAFNTDKEPCLPVLNAFLPRDVCCWAYAEVPEEFNPRRDALVKTYRYYAVWRGENLKSMRKAASFLIGTHDFKNLCKPRGGESTVRTLKEVKVEKVGIFLCFTLSARSFLWKMARKIVSALLMVGRGSKPPEFITRLLDPNFKVQEGVEPAKPEGLILYDIMYPFEFKVCEKSKRTFLKYLNEMLYSTLTLSAVYDTLREKLCGSPLILP